MNPMMAKPIAVAFAIFWNSFLSGFVHLLTSLSESLENCRRGSIGPLYSFDACVRVTSFFGLVSA